MKLELVYMAQALARCRVEHERAMAICEAALADILAESVASTLPPPVLSPPVPIPEPPRQTPRFRYAPGQLRASVLAIYRSMEECSLKEALTHLRVEHPETSMNSLSGSIVHLVADGYLQHGEQRGVYRLVETKPHLSMVAP